MSPFPVCLFHGEDAKGFGVVQVNDDGRVLDFVEKPQSDEAIEAVSTDLKWIEAKGIDPKGRDCIASMGIYVFNRKLLSDVLTQSEFTDFGKEVFPQTIDTHHVQMHLFDGYWEDIGTIRSFYNANLNLTEDDPEFDLFQPQAPIYTRPRFLPPSTMSQANVERSLIASGCFIGKGSTIKNSIVGLRTIVDPDVTIKDSIVMGCDFLSTRRPRASPQTGPNENWSGKCDPRSHCRQKCLYRKKRPDRQRVRPRFD